MFVVGQKWYVEASDLIDHGKVKIQDNNAFHLASGCWLLTPSLVLRLRWHADLRVGRLRPPTFQEYVQEALEWHVDFLGLRPVAWPTMSRPSPGQSVDDAVGILFLFSFQRPVCE